MRLGTTQRGARRRCWERRADGTSTLLFFNGGCFLEDALCQFPESARIAVLVRRSYKRGDSFLSLCALSRSPFFSQLFPIPPFFCGVLSIAVSFHHEGRDPPFVVPCVRNPPNRSLRSCFFSLPTLSAFPFARLRCVAVATSLHHSDQSVVLFLFFFLRTFPSARLCCLHDCCDFDWHLPVGLVHSPLPHSSPSVSLLSALPYLARCKTAHVPKRCVGSGKFANRQTRDAAR